MARKSKAASAASDVQIEEVAYMAEPEVVETFADVPPVEEVEDLTGYLKTFPYGIHIEYVLKDTLRFCDKAETVTMTVKFSHLDFEVPFTANAEDIYEHGRWLHEQAMVGAFGEITPYDRPLPNSHDLQLELDKLMVDITLGLATEDELSLARNLRKQIKIMEA